jgi:predicted tellurium resistance membrane protein TerC
MKSNFNTENKYRNVMIIGIIGMIVTLVAAICSMVFIINGWHTAEIISEFILGVGLAIFFVNNGKKKKLEKIMSNTHQQPSYGNNAIQPELYEPLPKASDELRQES